jgi:hypothetical protein
MGRGEVPSCRNAPARRYTRCIAGRYLGIGNLGWDVPRSYFVLTRYLRTVQHHRLKELWPASIGPQHHPDNSPISLWRVSPKQLLDASRKLDIRSAQRPPTTSVGCTAPEPGPGTPLRKRTRLTKNVHASDLIWHDFSWHGLQFHVQPALRLLFKTDSCRFFVDVGPGHAASDAMHQGCICTEDEKHAALNLAVFHSHESG